MHLSRHKSLCPVTRITLGREDSTTQDLEPWATLRAICGSRPLSTGPQILALKSPSKDQGDKSPKHDRHQHHPHASHRDRNPPALVVVDRKPAPSLRCEEKPVATCDPSEVAAEAGLDAGLVVRGPLCRSPPRPSRIEARRWALRGGAAMRSKDASSTGS